MLTFFLWLRVKTIGGPCEHTNGTLCSAKPGNILINFEIITFGTREFLMVYTSIPIRSEMPHLYLIYNRIELLYLGLLFDF
jgi:hypothetical protein